MTIGLSKVSRSSGGAPRRPSDCRDCSSGFTPHPPPHPPPHPQHPNTCHKPVHPPVPCKGACQPFKRLGQISDYKELFDALSQFKAWKDGVLCPLVENLDTSYQQLLGTNCILHQIAALVTDSVENKDLDHLMHRVDDQLRVMCAHLKTLRDGPTKLSAFKRHTMKKMSTLQNRYATTFKLMQPRSRPTPSVMPRFRDHDTRGHENIETYKDRSTETHAHRSRRRKYKEDRKRKSKHKKRKKKKHKKKHKKKKHKHHRKGT